MLNKLAKIFSMIFLMSILLFQSGLAICDPPNFSGDWNISSGEVCTNSSIELNITGDLNINGSLTLSNSVLIWINDDLIINGNLTIDNTTIRMNGTSDGASTIEVKSGGKFNSISNSIITNGISSDSTYPFTYEANSQGLINNTEIYKLLGTGTNGLEIFADGIIIENSIIADSEGYGIRLEGGSNRIYNTTIYNVIDDCIDINGASQNDIISNTLYNCNNGIYMDYSNYTNVLDNIIRDVSTVAITTKNNHNNTFNNNNITNGTWGGFWLSASSENNITGNNIINNGEAGIYMEISSNNNIITDNVINDNLNAGIYLDTCSGNIFLRNTFFNNTDGLEAIGSDVLLNYFANSTITSSTNNDVLLTTDSDVVFVNVTFNKASASIADTSSLNVTWYMDVTVLDTDTLNPLVGATLTIEDTNNVLRFNGVTNGFGKIATQIFNEYEESTGGKTYLSDYDVNASKVGFVDRTNTTSFTSSETVFVILNTFIPTLTGTIRDDCANSTQEGITVSNAILGTNTTDSNGVYTFYGDDGAYLLSFRKAGFHSGTEDVTISGDTEHNITIRESYCATYGAGHFALTLADFFVGVIFIIGSLAVLVVMGIIWGWYKK